MTAIELVQPTATSIPQQADTDAQLIGLWLHGRSPRTPAAYAADMARFLDAVGKPLRAVTLGDLQHFADSLGELAPASQARMLPSVKVAADLRPKGRLSPVQPWRRVDPAQSQEHHGGTHHVGTGGAALAGSRK